MTVFIEQIRCVCDADKSRNRIEQIGKQDADNRGQKRQLQRAENVQFEEDCFEVRRAENVVSGFDQTKNPTKQRGRDDPGEKREGA